MEIPQKLAIHPSILHVRLHVILLFSMSILLCLQPVASLGVMRNETDRLALLDIKAKISGDPHRVLSSWNDSAHFCTWQGVTCGHKHQRVMSLSLHDLGLVGTISPHIGNLTFLRDLSLGNNQLHGEIPAEVGRLFRLRNLNMSINTLEGKIPVNISHCSELRVLNVSTNNLVGEIPVELHYLKKLVVLRLPVNNLTGEIPRSLGNISTLQVFSLAVNNLQGGIPNELGYLTSLTAFAVGLNNLSGKIPSTLYNISSINIISIPSNNFNDSIPANIGSTFPALQKFLIGGNQFHGTIPVSLFNASDQFMSVDVSDNFFRGQVPSNICYLNSLVNLFLEINMLGDNRTGDLIFVESLSNCSNLVRVTFDTNNFGGELPRSIGNLSTELLYMGANHISGRIPAEVGNVVSLVALGLEENYFSGSIPISFGKLVNLQLLGLHANLLSGKIPPSLGNLTQLFELTIYANNLEGNIPSRIGKLQNLNTLDISHNKLTGTIPQEVTSIFSLSKILNLSQNSFTGPLPLEIGKLKNINQLDISENKLSGEIPWRLGDCLMLEILYMQGNLFQGKIPSSFASFRGLQYLDLSRNNLSGNIPKELERLLALKYLNLSFNNLEGKVPTKGVFSNASAISLVGNTNLCGGIPELQLPACPVVPKKSRRSTMALILATTVSSVVLFVMVLSSYFLYRRKSRKNLSSMPSIVESLPRISYQELSQATGGFSSANLIGQGSMGSVYRGSLDKQGERERLVAVKVLNLQQHGAVKSFISECNALRNVRHRNLVKLLTYCSSIDFKGNDFKALVYDFMENGCLGTWLHPEEASTQQSRHLTLVQRLLIAVDVSSALHYLHDNCETPIIHCDLKPSNILLDNDMTAHVGDFGLAKLLSPDSSQGKTSSTGMKGTIGYMAPEYGVGSKATTYGDVYSFGIMLLEIFTGRRPTNEIFTNDGNLHNFVRANLPKQIMQVVDPVLITSGELGALGDTMEDNDNEVGIENNANIRNFTQDGGGDARNCIASVLAIGLTCSSTLPGDRMNMRDVTRKLNVITKTFLQAKTRRDRQIVAP